MAVSPATVVERVYVWDTLIRTLHALLALSVIANMWLLEGGEAPHQWLGYTLVGLVAVRLVWGVVGSEHARFVNFFPTPTRLLAYLHGRGRATRGHNPLGALMALAMLALILALGVSGWLMGTDKYWGEPWLEDLHDLFSNALLICAALHIAGVVFVSVRTRINLPRAMLTGYKERSSHSLPFDATKH